MKKLVCLVLALVMVLSTAAALAMGSMTLDDLTDVTTDKETVFAEIDKTVVADDAGFLQFILTSIGEGKVLKDAIAEIYPEAIAALKEAGINVDTMPVMVLSESIKIAVEGAVADGDEVSFIISFAVAYEPGDELPVLLGLMNAKGEYTSWLAVKGKVNDNGKVIVKLTAEQLKKVAGASFRAFVLKQP